VPECFVKQAAQLTEGDVDFGDLNLDPFRQGVDYRAFHNGGACRLSKPDQHIKKLRGDLPDVPAFSSFGATVKAFTTIERSIAAPYKVQAIPTRSATPKAATPTSARDASCHGCAACAGGGSAPRFLRKLHSFSCRRGY
jgi:hypothetical protein